MTLELSDNNNSFLNGLKAIKFNYLMIKKITELEEVDEN